MRKIPPPEKLESYWYALGKFVQRYAEVEYALNNVLRLVSRTTLWQAQMLFSGFRVRDAMQTIKRFYSASDTELDPWLARCFPKLGEITTLRDRLLHYGVEDDSGEFLVTDAHKNIAPRAFRMTITADDLDDLEADTITCLACLNAFWLEVRSPNRSRKRLERERQLALAPWRYRPPRPKRSQASSQRAARKQSLPPQS